MKLSVELVRLLNLMQVSAAFVTVASSVRLSHSCTALKPSDGMRCDLAFGLPPRNTVLGWGPTPLQKGNLVYLTVLSMATLDTGIHGDDDDKLFTLS